MPTNYETLEWLKPSTDNTKSESNIEAARTFFGNYNGTRKMFSEWKERFSQEHKKVKPEDHTRLVG